MHVKSNTRGGPKGRRDLFYSTRILLTGFAIPARTAWKLTVTNAINITTRPKPANIHTDSVTLYGYRCNHLSAPIHTAGIATINATTTNRRKSLDTSATMTPGEAPKTFRTPISFVLFSTENTDSPNSPTHEIKMVTREANNNICFHFSSAS